MANKALWQGTGRWQTCFARECRRYPRAGPCESWRASGRRAGRGGGGGWGGERGRAEGVVKISLATGSHPSSQSCPVPASLFARETRAGASAKRLHSTDETWMKLMTIASNVYSREIGGGSSDSEGQCSALICTLHIVRCEDGVMDGAGLQLQVAHPTFPPTQHVGLTGGGFARTFMLPRACRSSACSRLSRGVGGGGGGWKEHRSLFPAC